MGRKIHHIGIAVKDLKKATKFYQDILGLTLDKELDWEKEGLKAALFPVGDTILELIEPLNPKGQIAQSVADAVNLRDGIIHHLCYTVNNIEEEIKSLVSKGIMMFDEKLEETPGGKAAWLDKKTIEGCMIELVEEGYEIT